MPNQVTVSLAQSKRSLGSFTSKDQELRRLIYSWVGQQESPHTKRAYLQIAAMFFGLFPGLSIREIQVEHVALFKQLQKEKFSNATCAMRVAAIRGLFRWLNEQQVIDKDPARAIRIPRPESNEGRTPELTDAEVKRLLAAPDRNIPREARDGALLDWLYHLGLRRSEILALRVKDISQEGAYTVAQVRGKGNRLRRLPLKSHLIECLEQYMTLSGRDRSNPDSFLFVGCAGSRQWNEKPLTGTALLNLVRKYAKRAGVKRKLCVHTARVTAANNALEKGASDSAVMALCGWSSAQSIQRYTRRREQLRNNAADRISY